MTLNYPTNGAKMGCNDTAAPETHTAQELSALHDAMVAGEAAGLDRTSVFALAPLTKRMEYNFANWRYVAREFR